MSQEPTSVDVGKGMAAGQDTPSVGSDQVEPLCRKPFTHCMIHFLRGYFILWSLFSAYVVVGLWPSVAANVTSGPATQSLSGGCVPCLHQEARWLVIVLAMGVIGSSIHSMTVLCYFIGCRLDDRTWFSYYILQPFVGALLALIFYLAQKSGLLTGGGVPQAPNSYALAATAGVVGMFSRQASELLGELLKGFGRGAARTTLQGPSVRGGQQLPVATQTTRSTPITSPEGDKQKGEGPSR